MINKIDNQQPSLINNYQEGSETIPKGSTQCRTDCGSVYPLTCNDEGDDIVQRKNHFLEKAIEKFGNKFTYDLSTYKTAKTKMRIICPVHGEFWQKPDKHLSSKFGCSKCALKLKTKTKPNPEMFIDNTMSETEFLEKANSKYNNKFKYIIDNWQGLSKTVITVICPIHGEFQTIASNHLQKQNQTGCLKCGFELRANKKTSSYDDVILEFRQVHGDRYIYPDSNREFYRTKRDKIKIICPEHGEFWMTPQKHLSGQRCKKCAKIDVLNSGILVGGYCEDLFNDNPELKEKDGLLYYLKINGGKLYKIGITTTCTNDRIKGLKAKAKSFGYKWDIEIVNEKNMSLYEAFKIEQSILENNIQHRVYTKISTELFNIDIFENIKDFF